MPVTVLCPRLHCRTVLRVPDHVRGKRVRCGVCGTTFMVPEVVKAAPKPAPNPADEKADAGK